MGHEETTMKIAILVTSRADAGILEPLMSALPRALVLDTSSWSIRSDLPLGQAQSVGTVGMMASQWLFDNHIDTLVVLGDRYETVAASLGAYTLHIPIVHLEGGEYTTGSLDDGYRWCVSNMATWHCAATYDSARRLRAARMTHVHHTGALGCYELHNVKPDVTTPYDYVFCYHPSKNQYNPRPYIDLLAKRGTVLWVGPNKDAGSGLIRAQMHTLSQNVTMIPSLPRSCFLSTLKAAKAMVGNSSTGIIEAPSLGVVSINIGDRQKGRETAKSVIHCKESVSALKEALLIQDRRTTSRWMYINPYHKANCLKEIIKVLNKNEH
jgi:UDP-hydrolysing UDP-N-acetyl-D-glucosamine 2-epimerase